VAGKGWPKETREFLVKWYKRMQVKALPKSTTEMTDERCQADKMRGPKRRRELTTMQLAKQLSTGQSWLPGWTREVSAKVKPYGSGRLCTDERINHSATGIWRWINQAAIKIWGRDLQELVSSLVLGMAGEASLDLSYCPVCHTGQGWGRKADEQDYYLCPWNILCKEGDGRSWAINNTSNISGVE
jgi:hypothetical protein